MKYFKIMRYFLLLLFSSILFSASGQKRAYLDSRLNPAADSVNARYYLVTKKLSPELSLKQLFLKNGRLVSEESLDPRNNNRHGYWREWHANTGQRRLEAHFISGRLDGSFKTYFENGQLRRDEMYKKGEMLSGKCFTKTGQDTTFYAFETPPVYPGGNPEFFSYLRTNLKKITRKESKAIKRILGRTVVTFIIENDGTITDARIVKGVNERIDQEVLKLINQMPRWQPGRQDGKPVKVLFTLPIRFNSYFMF